jgi:hypothetical protein
MLNRSSIFRLAMAARVNRLAFFIVAGFGSLGVLGGLGVLTGVRTSIVENLSLHERHSRRRRNPVAPSRQSTT